MTVVENVGSHAVDLTGGRQLGPGQTANVDLAQANEAALLAAGLIVVTDGSQPPWQPIATPSFASFQDFQPYTAYPANYPILHGGQLQVAKVAFNSGAAYNAADWNALVTSVPSSVELNTNKDQPSGYAGLDAGGKLKLSEQPPSVASGSLDTNPPGTRNAPYQPSMLQVLRGDQTSESRFEFTAGLKAHAGLWGIRDNACLVSLIGNRESIPDGHDPSTEVTGVTNGDVSSGTERAAVTLYNDVAARSPYVYSSATTFTATSVAFTAGVDLSQVKPGMTIDITRIPGGGLDATAVGIVDSVVGQTVNIDATLGWRAGGSPVATPANGTLAIIGGLTKIWARNTVMFSNVNVEGIGYLPGVCEEYNTNNSAASAWTTDMRWSEGWQAAPVIWGVDVVTITGKGTLGQCVRGAFHWGFASNINGTGDSDPRGSHFVAHNQGGTGTPQACFTDLASAVPGASFRAIRGAAGTLIDSWIGVSDSNGTPAQANPQFSVTHAGQLGWGPGTTTVDTTLGRSSVGVLTLTGGLILSGDLTLSGSASNGLIARSATGVGTNVLSARAAADTVDRFQIGNNGFTQWGAGSGARDVALKRSNAGELSVRNVGDTAMATLLAAVKVKAGAPTDADYSGPVDGLVVVDTTNSKIWARTGGAWKGVAIA